MSERLLVKIAVEDLASERLQIGLSVAAAAVAAGLPVSLWLAGEAARLGTAAHRTDDQTAELLAAILGSADVQVCARCAQRRGITEQDLLPGAAIAGAAAFVAEAMRPQTRALVY